MNHCQICEQKPYISFHWEYANEGKDKELARLSHHLQPVRPLKFGHLYQCPISQNYWLLDDDHLFMYSVPSDKVEALWQWDRTSLVVADAQIKVLASIGAAGLRQDGYESSEVQIPCAVRSIHNEFYDPALAIITKIPPIQRWQKRFVWGNRSDVIEPSDLSLPLPVRIATCHADEINMGFAPTLVKASSGQYFVLSGAEHFFSSGSLEGKDISLSERAFRRGDNFPIIHQDIQRVTFIYFDWYDGCRTLVHTSASYTGA